MTTVIVPLLGTGCNVSEKCVLLVKAETVYSPRLFS